MDFVAKILIDQQDIAGRMSRGGERCEIDLGSMQLIRLPPWNMLGFWNYYSKEEDDYQNLR